MDETRGAGHGAPVPRCRALERQLELAEWEWLETGAYRRKVREW